MTEIIVKQGNVYDVEISKNFHIIDNGFGPCIIIIYIFGDEIKILKYVHLDETGKSEFKSTLSDMKGKGVNRCVLLGGRGSDLINFVLKTLKANRISVFSDNSFGVVGITALEIDNTKIILKGNNGVILKKCSFRILLEMFGIV